MKLINRGSTFYELQEIEPGASIKLHLKTGIKLVIDNGSLVDDSISLSVSGGKVDSLIQVYDNAGDDLGQILAKAGGVDDGVA